MEHRFTVSGLGVKPVVGAVFLIVHIKDQHGNTYAAPIECAPGEALTLCNKLTQEPTDPAPLGQTGFAGEDPLEVVAMEDAVFLSINTHLLTCIIPLTPMEACRLAWNIVPSVQVALASELNPPLKVCV